MNSLLNAGDMLPYIADYNIFNLSRLDLYTVTLNYTSDFISIQSNDFN